MRRLWTLWFAAALVALTAVFAASAAARGGHDRDAHQNGRVEASQQQQAKLAAHLQLKQQKQAEENGAGDHKITICHATGSTTNPFVVITVDKHALKNGHTTAKGDIIPAPAGGCPTSSAAQTESEQTLKTGDDHKITICHATGSTTNPFVVITVDKHALKNGHTTAKGDIIPAPAGGCPTSAPAAAANVVVSNATEAPTAAAAPQSQGQVLGAVSPLTKAKAHARGGVLGAVGNIAGATLPFTGFPVWLVVSLALVLLAAGVALRRGGGAVARQ